MVGAVAMMVARETSGEATVVEEAGTTTGTAAEEAGSPKAAEVANSNSTAKIGADSHCPTKVERDGSEEAALRGEITPADWRLVPRTIRMRVELRSREMEERRDMAVAEATIKETEPEASNHRTTTNRFPHWEVNRLE